MAGLFNGLLVEKCAACQSHWKSDFEWHRVHLTWCVRGLKSLKRFWPYLIASGPASRLVSLRNSFVFMFVVVCCFFFWFHEVERSLYAASHVCKI